jgi:hypothetical protein
MNSICLTHGTDTPLYLEGSAIAAPFRGASYTPRSGPDSIVEEEIDMALETHTPAAIAGAYSALERLLTAANEYALGGIGKPVYLECVGVSGDAPHRAPVRAGWIEPLGGERSRGSVGLRLHLAREPWWEQSAEAQLKLALPGQASTTSEITILNHRDDDTGHVNVFQVLAADAAGDLPAACRLEIRPIGSGMLNFFLAADRNPVSGGDTFLDSSLFDSLFTNTSYCTSSIDATCSYGQKLAASWSGTTEILLFQWLMTATNIAPGQGRLFKPVMRCPGGIPCSDLWLRFRIKGIGSNVIWDGPWALAPNGTELFDLAPIPMPPNLSRLAEKYGPITLEALARRISGSATTFNFDFLTLFPTDSFVKGIGKTIGCQNSRTLFIDGMSQEIYSGANRSAGFDDDFQVMGSPALPIVPGRLQRFTFHGMDTAGSAPVSRSYGVQAWYRPRKRFL